MSRELRLAFAMGGGVSLGTFSGAALSEAIKLAILYGKYPENGSRHRYDRVVIDVFSGASAGAMSLAAMLRTLVHRTEEQEQRAERNLRRILKEEYDVELGTLDLSPEEKKTLVAAQAVQDTQERVWVDEIDIRRLLGQKPNGESRNLRYAGGVLDRGAVENIAQDAISFPDGVDLSGRTLLADRVLFACTLANLTPIVHDAKADLDTVKKTGFAGLGDALTSKAHRDIRVFDLNFAEVGQEEAETQSRYPDRWCRYHVKEEVPGRVGDLRLEKTWNKIAKTAIAAGAFPFAFEPVVLERRDYEYGDLWPEELAEKGIEKYPFTFVDGGTFNNEPIREAFRLSAVLDAQYEHQNYDRRIIFVDPLVDADERSFQVPIHQQYEYQDPNFFGALDGTDLYRRSTFDRLKSHAGTVLSAVLNQGRVIEEDKIFQVRKRFDIRNDIRAYVREVLTERPSYDQLAALKEFCEGLLENNRNLVIPPGTLTLQEELERVLVEEADDSAFEAHQGEVQSALTALENEERPEDADFWLQALLFVAIDLVMNLEGKHPNNRVIAVTPTKVEAPEEETDPVQTEPYELPGARLMGFGGFMSTVADRYHVRLARYCTWQFLQLCDLTPDAPAPIEPQWTKQKKEQFQRDFENGLTPLIQRLEDVIEESHFLNLSFLNEPTLNLIARFVRKAMEQYREEEPDRQRCEFRIKVPGKSFEIDGRPDQKPVRPPPEGEPHLVVYAEYGPRSEEDPTPEWKGPFVDESAQRIEIDREGRPDRLFCSIFLPSLPETIETADLLPDPVFYTEIREEHEGEDLHPEEWTLRLPPASLSREGKEVA